MASHKDEKSGRRRLDIKDDWVRLEILTFLKRKKATRSNDLLILPLLVNGATMPARNMLTMSWDLCVPINLWKFQVEVASWTLSK